MDVAVFMLRVGLGLILMFYGAQKLLGVFGGSGPAPTIEIFRSEMGIPAPFTILAMCGEFFGGLGMIVGLLTPVAAFGAFCTMAVATYENWRTPGVVHGVFVEGKGDPSRLFFTIAIMLGCFAVMMIGAGNASLDAKLFPKGKGRR